MRRYIDLVEDYADVRSKELDYSAEREAAHAIGLSLDPSWANTLTRDEMNALMWYKSDGSVIINANLRGHDRPDLEYSLDDAESFKDYHGYDFHMTEDRAVQLLDQAIAKCRVSKNFVCYRGIKDARVGLEMKEMAVGQTFTDPAFISTSLHPQYAFTFALRTGWKPNEKNFNVMQIKIKAGTPAIYASYEDGTEAEVILGRDRRFKKTAQRIVRVPGATHYPSFNLMTFEVD